MKKLNLKKHVAIALAVLSANSSLSVFANGNDKQSQITKSQEESDSETFIDGNFRLIEQSFSDRILNLFRYYNIKLEKFYKPYNYVWIEQEFSHVHNCIRSLACSNVEITRWERKTFDGTLEYLKYALRYCIPEDMCNEILKHLNDMFDLLESSQKKGLMNLTSGRIVFVANLRQCLASVKYYTLCACASIKKSDMKLINPLQKLVENEKTKNRTEVVECIMATERFEKARKRYKQSISGVDKEEKEEALKEYKSAIYNFRFFDGLSQWAYLDGMNLLQKNDLET